MIAIKYLEDRLKYIDEDIARAERGRDHFASEASELIANRTELVDELIRIRAALDA